ncbi:MAG: tyrosine--tRNA ligase [Polyangiaceae bacterium]|nr:tyrosine--tRNA ligase [Polyangiaceae bacterium]
MSVPEALAELTRGAVDVVSREDLEERLGTGRPLRVKAGFDPTRPDLHLGHTVLLEKLRAFQELGHEVVFLIGDFTARVGDPTGQNEQRPRLTREQVMAAAATYQEQAFKVLDRARTTVRYNGEWLERLSLVEVVELAAKRTLARTLERRDFRERFDAERDIHLHELLYPLLQGYDSVALECDVELGGTDQLFNLMVGRDLMRSSGQRPQIVMTTPLLEGLDAKVADGRVVGKKMSKSADNYVGIDEPPVAIYRKCMQVDDRVVRRWFDLLSRLPTRAIDELFAAGDPLAAKHALAAELVGRYHGAAAAEAAAAEFRGTYLGIGIPTELELVEIGTAPVVLARALAQAGLCASNSDARRQITQGGVELDGARVTDEWLELGPGEYVVRVGSKNRRFRRFRVGS